MLKSKILRYFLKIYSFQTSNGIFREERGELANAGQPDEHLVVRGSFSYIDPDGKLVVVHFIADDKGYQVSPPAPPTTVSILYRYKCLNCKVTVDEYEKCGNH